MTRTHCQTPRGYTSRAHDLTCVSLFVRSSRTPHATLTEHLKRIRLFACMTLAAPGEIRTFSATSAKGCRGCAGNGLSNVEMWRSIKDATLNLLTMGTLPLKAPTRPAKRKRGDLRIFLVCAVFPYARNQVRA